MVLVGFVVVQHLKAAEVVLELLGGTHDFVVNFENGTAEYPALHVLPVVFELANCAVLVSEVFEHEVGNDDVHILGLACNGESHFLFG